MNPTPASPLHRLPSLPHRNSAAALFSATALLLAPSLLAQSTTPQPPPAASAPQSAPRLYSMKFEGSHLAAFAEQLKAAFPKDNVVVSPAALNLRLSLDPFEIRDVTLNELGKTIEFLSDGWLSVDVVEGGGTTTGNIWRIGRKSSPTTTGPLKIKTRSVAAPQLFADKQKIERLIKDAEMLENLRIEGLVDSARNGNGDFSSVAPTRIEPLPDQKIFVLVGDEDGIAGMESFIKAAEQLALGDAAKSSGLASSLAPSMRAVLAPHLFANEDRLDRITDEFNNVQGLWDESHSALMHQLGIDNRRSAVCIQPRQDQKLFVLIGSPEGITGMESLILAAEKNAADEDAIIMARKAKEDARLEAVRKAAAPYQKDSPGAP